jgi:serine/threonine protein kinase
MRLRIARDIASVFDFMHSIGIVHRDLKSHNILIDEHMHVKVIDFGLAKFKADLNKGSMQYSGTPTYMAPELF